MEGTLERGFQNFGKFCASTQTSPDQRVAKAVDDGA